ncbi:hepcidin-1 isoform X1 [Carassius auratus]|uniref:Hepcidin-1 isoform X1 n=1 Tax=Carassius auratus TaxID=7957 RepID=A0A6P6LG80_CARAU|nr:hepcidin-1-like isoform X1 [Carassius auratus]
MKFSRVALAALVIIACVCILQTTAVPFTQQTEDEHHVQNEHLTETSQEQTNPLAFFRVKRQSHLSLCRYCCNCCRNKGCGYCCKF